MKVFEVNGDSLALSLFSDVTNSKELLESVQSGTSEPEVAFLNASLVTESLKRCGVSESSSYVLGARFSASADEMKAIDKLVNGVEIDLEELEARADKDPYSEALQDIDSGIRNIISRRCYYLSDRFS